MTCLSLLCLVGNRAEGKLGICDWEVTCLSTGKTPALEQVIWKLAQVQGSDYAGSLQAVMSSEQQLKLIACLDKILHKTFFFQEEYRFGIAKYVDFPPSPLKTQYREWHDWWFLI